MNVQILVRMFLELIFMFQDFEIQMSNLSDMSVYNLCKSDHMVLYLLGFFVQMSTYI